MPDFQRAHQQVIAAQPVLSGLAEAHHLAAKRVEGIGIAQFYPLAVVGKRFLRGFHDRRSAGFAGLVHDGVADGIGGAGMAELAGGVPFGAGLVIAPKRGERPAKLVVEAAILRFARDGGLTGLQRCLGLDLVGEAGEADAFRVEVVGGLEIAGVGGEVDLHQSGRSVQVKLELDLQDRVLAKADGRAADIGEGEPLEVLR